MDRGVAMLFERYERCFNRSLGGEMDKDEAVSFYTPQFIAASPAGVATGNNDESLKQTLEQGYAYYREIGTREMRIRAVRVSQIDDAHCVAHVAWTAFYARKDGSETTIDFDVHYLVQTLGGDPKIFGWVSGDERALLKRHGIV